jgi:putative methyltransferase (TIGR04325 family)
MSSAPPYSFPPMPSRRLSLARRWIAPGLRDIFNRMTGHAIVYEGEFKRWQDAEAAAGGYDDDALVSRLEAAALAVGTGGVAWEQDGVTHDHVPADLPQLACLAQVALSHDGHLSVLDFGGGLGSSYRQCRTHLHGLRSLQWHIVEQPRLVAAGRSRMEDGTLRFHDTIAQTVAQASPKIALLSSVLQYLPEPYAVLDELIAAGLDFLLIDRHPCSFGAECITVQKIPPRLYAASYPSWLFDRAKMWTKLADAYEPLLEWPGKDPSIRGRNGLGAYFVGGFWRRRGLP